MVFKRSAIGIAVRRGRPIQKKSGVYMIAPPRPSIEKTTATKNAMNIISIKSIASFIRGRIDNAMEEKFMDRELNIVRKDTNE